MLLHCPLPPHWHIGFAMRHKHRIPGDPQVQKPSESQNNQKVSVLFLWLSVVPTALRGHTSPSNKNFSWNIERRQWCSKKHELPCTPLVFFLIRVTSLYRPGTQVENQDIEGTGKTEQPQFLLLSVLTVISKNVQMSGSGGNKNGGGSFVQHSLPFWKE